MGNKTVSKSKVKPLHAPALTKKPVSLKSFQYGKGGKGLGLKPKSVLAGESKVDYGSQLVSAMQIHDTGHGAEFAVAPAALETTPLEQETELADQLVDEVAGNGTDVNALCRTYQLKREELGRLTGFSLRALAEWARGKLPSQPAKRRLQEVRRLLDALAEIVKRESIPKWLHQPNPAFERLTPLQVIELGEIDRLWAMVHDLGSGQPE
jgi:DNA-binding transcriptional regulator YiaG